MKNIIFTIIILTTTHAYGQGWQNPLNSPAGAKAFREKAEKKAGSRWTLREWMEQKEKNKMMDLWLGMYAPSPYEFVLGGGYLSYEKRVDSPLSNEPYRTIQGHAAFYAMILGIEIQHENNTEEKFSDTAGMLNLRIAGNAVQGTHLILQAGTNTRKTETTSLTQNFGGADVDLYIERHIGIHYNYRQYLPTTEASMGTVNQKRWEAGAFFDVNFVRFFGNWYSDTVSTDLNGTKTNIERAGLIGGARFFF